MTWHIRKHDQKLRKLIKTETNHQEIQIELLRVTQELACSGKLNKI